MNEQRTTVYPSHRLPEDIQYIPNPVHRNRTPKKSQWTITVPEEIDVFRNALSSRWVQSTEGWGLYLPSGVVEYLGIDRRLRRTFVAKFVDAQSLGTWHGYPAEHNDRPAAYVLRAWMQFLRPQIVNKLSRGVPCKL